MLAELLKGRLYLLLIYFKLRDQQESATEKLESSCFICDIGKEMFDRLPRGFEIHTKKEHNFANYL